jgi:hypothetical protein
MFLNPALLKSLIPRLLTKLGGTDSIRINRRIGLIRTIFDCPGFLTLGSPDRRLEPDGIRLSGPSTYLRARPLEDAA